MKFSLSTGTLYIYPLRTVFRWARLAGFGGVELVVNPEAIARGGKAVQRMAAEEGIEIWTLHPTVIWLPGWHERYGGMDRTIKLAREVGAGLVVMHTPRVARLDEGKGLAFRQRIEAWQAQYSDSGLQLAVENKAIRGPADLDYALTPLEQLRAFAERYDLGLVLDTAHAGTAGEDLIHARQVFAGRLRNVHLSDGVEGGTALLPRTVDKHLFPGEGELALRPLLADLRRNDYASPVTLEVNPFAVKFWWPPAVRRRLTQALQWMKAAAQAMED